MIMCKNDDNIDAIQMYLKKLLDNLAAVNEVDKEISSRLPNSIISSFDIHMLNILGKDLLLLVDTNEETYSPGQIRKLQDLIVRVSGLVPVFAFQYVASYNIQRLVAQRVNFIVPGKQLFIPSILMDLSLPKADSNNTMLQIPVMAQCVVLYHLQVEPLNGKTTQNIVELFGVSYPNINRAIKWLSDKAFIVLEGAKTKSIRFNSEGRQLWNEIEPMLVSPIERVVYTDEWLDNAFTTGLNALSEYTMLNPDKDKAYAIGKEDYLTARQNTHKEFGGISIEVWKYNPSLLTHTNTVDKLSLYLSLRNNEDERVQIELDNMINEMIW